MHNEYSWSDIGPDSTNFIYPQLRKLLSKEKNKMILDVGCGNGQIANMLIAEGFNVYGIDASSEGVKIANKANPGHFFVNDVESDQLPSDLQSYKFDTIISTEVIEHIYSPDAYMTFCEKIFDSRSGTLLISTPYHGYLKNLVLAITGKLDSHFTALWEGGHIKFWSRKTLSALLEKHGFHVKRFAGCGRIMYLWKSMILVSDYNK